MPFANPGHVMLIFHNLVSDFLSDPHFWGGSKFWVNSLFQYLKTARFTFHLELQVGHISDGLRNESKLILAHRFESDVKVIYQVISVGQQQCINIYIYALRNTFLRFMCCNLTEKVLIGILTIFGFLVYNKPV